MAKESSFQKKLKDEIKLRFPGSIITKLDPGDTQGIPDLLVLYKDRWAALECKKSKDEPHQPNQDYYVDKLNNMSFSAFIFPENREEVLNAMEQSLESSR